MSKQSRRSLCRSRRSQRSLLQHSLEPLEIRITPTGNIAVSNAVVVDSSDTPITTVHVGDSVYIQTDFNTTNLPSNATYNVATTVNGMTRQSSTLNWGAGDAGPDYWNFYWGTFLATPGINQVSVTVDPTNSVAESSYSDNTFTFTFNAVTPASSSFISYTAAQMRDAYGLNSLPDFGSTPADGTGQTIAIINGGNDPSVFADVDGFDQAMSLTTTSTESMYQQYGAASSFLTVYNQFGVNITSDIANSGMNGVPVLPSSSEESWDIQWAHTMAPGAKIVEIEFDPTGNWPQNLLDSYALAGTIPGVSAANWSGGLGQWSTESSDDSTDFVTPNGHTGVTYICPSNDNGANVYPQYGQGDGYYPSTSPNVLSVGGTTLTLDNNGYGGETGWSYPTPATTIDNGSGDYGQTGTWASQTGGFSGTYSTAAAGSSSTATWTVPVTPSNTGWGTELSTTWTANASNATNATYSVYDGAGTSGTLLGTITIDQTKAPAGTADNGSQFQELGVFFPTLDGSGDGTLTVVMNAQSANGTVVADAIGASQAWASTGGPAYYETEPSYQLPFQSTGYRTTPDVAFDADFSADGFGNGSVSYGGGGTSLGGPCWTGLLAVINQGRVAAGGTTLNSPTDPTQTLQAIYSLPSSDFHDITTGYNGFFAGPGYDLVTGRGSPIANLLIPDMVSYGISSPPTVTAPSMITVSQNSSLNFTGANAISVSDPSGTAEQLTVKVAHGTLNLSSMTGVTVTGNNSADLTITGSLSNLNSVLVGLSYQPTSGYHGTDVVSLYDKDTTDKLAGSKTINVKVSPLAPTLTFPATIGVSENGSFAFTGANAINVTDLSGTNEELVLTVSHGTLLLSTTTGLTFSGNGTASLQVTGSVTNLNNDLASLVYKPTSGYHGSDVIALWDKDTSDGLSSSYTRSITVTQTPPAIQVPPPVTIIENNSLTFSGANAISVTDLVGPVEELVLTVGHGTLLLGVTTGLTFSGNGTASVQVTGSITNLNNDLASLVYTPTTGYHGSDSLKLWDKDTSDGLTATNSLAITINPPAPTIHVPSPITMNRNTSFTFSGANAISLTDPSGTAEELVLTVAEGTLKLVTTTGLTVTGSGTMSLELVGSLSSLNADLSSLVYTPTTGYHGPDALKLWDKDTSDGLTATNSLSITVQ